MVASTFTVMAGSAIAPALPGIRASFADVPAVDVWVALIPGMSAAGTVVGAIAVGPLLVRHGARWVLVASLGLVGGAGLIGASAPSLGWLLTSRVLVGVGVAGTLTSTTTWIGDVLQGAERARVTGRHGVAMELAGTLFFWVSGVLAAVHWRGSFWLYGLALPVAVIGRWMPSGPAVTIRNAAASERGGEPRPRLRSPLLGAFAGMLVFGLWVVELPFYVDIEMGRTARDAGIGLAAATAGAALSGATFGWLRARLELTSLLCGALALMGLGMTGVATASSLGGVLGAMAVAGVGFGQIMPVAISWINAVTDSRSRAAGQAALTIAAFGGQVAAAVVSAGVGALGIRGQSSAFMGAGLIAVAFAIDSLRGVRRGLGPASIRLAVVSPAGVSPAGVSPAERSGA